VQQASTRGVPLVLFEAEATLSGASFPTTVVSLTGWQIARRDLSFVVTDL
jgi:hypothetical protein